MSRRKKRGRQKETCGWNTDSNDCFQNNKSVINLVHRRRKDLAQRKEQRLTCRHKAGSWLAFWENSYVSWAQHLQDLSYSRETQSLPAHINPFFTQTSNNALIMLLSGKCSAATAVSRKTFIPYDTSAAFTLYIIIHLSQIPCMVESFRLCVSYACLTDPTDRQLCTCATAECHCVPIKGKAAILKNVWDCNYVVIFGTILFQKLLSIMSATVRKESILKENGWMHLKLF